MKMSKVNDKLLLGQFIMPSAHGPIFCLKQLREKIGAILYRSKSQRTRTDFHSDFLSTIKKSVRVRWA